MTPAQIAILKSTIQGDGTLNSQPMNTEGAVAIQNLLNAAASPPFTIWKRSVSISEVGDNIVGNDLAGLSTLNTTRLQTIVLLSQDGVNASLADRRAFFDDVFSGAGGAATRAKLLILWKRLATRGEKIYATGTGSDASPATPGFEGSIDYNDVLQARSQ